MRYTITLLAMLLFYGFISYSQVKIGNNPAIINPNSVLELESTNKGFLPPRLTTQERGSIVNPAPGLLIFNKDINCLEIYNSNENTWKNLCGENSKQTSSYDVKCETMSVNGIYSTGIALDPSTNTLTVQVDVTTVGSYLFVTSQDGMTFSATGLFTSTGLQFVTLSGQGVPSATGTRFLSLTLNNSTCYASVNVLNGVSSISSCGSVTLSQPVVANTSYEAGDLIATLSGISFTGGNFYSLSSSSNNGIRLTSPLQGSFSTNSPGSFGINITGTPVLAGATLLTYSINNQTGCSVTVPILSGTGRASGLNCNGALAGVYRADTPANSSNTKSITLSTVTTTGTFNIRTNTVNGIFFTSSYSATSTGSQTVVLQANGTPVTSGSFTYTLSVSSTNSAFVTCTFNVSFLSPSSFPNYTATLCEPLNSTSVKYQYIKASNTNGFDIFGGATNNNTSFPILDANNSFNLSAHGKANNVKLSADGLTLAVGASGEDAPSRSAPTLNTVDNSGAVYIYSRSNLNSSFTFQAFIKPDDTLVGSQDFFGSTLDISNDGNVLVVASAGENSNSTGVNPVSNDGAFDSGAVYVFIRTGSNWSQIAFLKSNNPQSYDYFGTAVAVSGDGNTIAVGAPYEDSSSNGIDGFDNNSSSNSGAVYLYYRSSNTVSFAHRVKPNIVRSGDVFGSSVDLNNVGNILVIGAIGEDGGGTGVNPLSNQSQTNAGAVFVFSKTANSWEQSAYLKASNTNTNASFGSGVSLDGDGTLLAVSAFAEDGNLESSTGATNSGAVYTYKFQTGNWSFSQRLKADNFESDDYFGSDIQLSNDGSTLIIGAHGEDTSITTVDCPNFTSNNSLTNSGSIYIFRQNNNQFIQAQIMKMRTESLASSGASSNDLGGKAVTISGDGKAFAYGIGREDGSGTLVNSTVNNSSEDSGGVVFFNVD